jgi:hypothetical protein
MVLSPHRLFAYGAGLASIAVLGGCWLFAALGDVPTETGPSQGGDAGYGGPSRCDASSFAFCDGFEQGLGAWTQAAKGGGTLSVDSAHVARGQFALHSKLPPVATAGATVQAVVTHSQHWPQPMWVRFFLYLSPSGATHASLTDLLTLNDTAPLSGTNIYLLGDGGDVALATFGASVGSMTAGALPTNEWACLELEVDGANAQIWINDAPIVKIAFPVDTVALLANLGLNYVQAQVGDGDYDAWFDEFAVDDQYIACDR